MTSTQYDFSSKDESTKTSKDISYFSLFRFASTWELILLLTGFIFATIKALIMPCVLIVYGEFCALLVDRNHRNGTISKTIFLELLGGGRILPNATFEENQAEIFNDAMSYGILMGICAVVLFISGIFAVDIFNYAALKQITRMRMMFFRSIIRQDIGWHDNIHDQNFALRITDDIEKIRDGISEKLGHFLNLVMGFLITICISFVYGWKLTLAVSVYIPIVIVTNLFVTKYQSKLTIREMDSYANAGSVAEEVLSGIRTVVAFNGEEKEAERYDNYLMAANRAGQKKGAFSGFGEGVMRSLLFISCAGAFWYGVHLILNDRYKEEKEYTPAILMIAFFGIIVGADNISKTSPFIEAFAMARGSGKTIFNVIETRSKIDPMSLDGKILNYGLRGDIEFQDIFFRYPSREDVTVLRGISFKIEFGQTVALVGNSGCGKSTCIQLIQRFYDPVFGQILLDNFDIRKYNLSWLRSNIAIVGQEPVLFADTVAENIRHGKFDATQKEIEEAAKASGVHDFIISLPNSYQTVMGEKGTQLSGGQKQRIAIARALIQNPRILLLDEATSALDYHSEKSVQESLDAARKGRTTIVVSHRLSAIKNADKIVFIEDGKVAEEGTHEELMKLNGKYYKMVTVGDFNTNNTEEIEEEENNEFAMFEKTFETDIKNLNINHNNYGNNHHVHFIPVPIKEMEGEPDDDTDTDYWQSFQRLLMEAKPEWGYLILGTIAAAFFGCTYPSFAILFGEFYGALAMENEDEALDAVSILCISFLVIGIGTGIVCFLTTYLFNLSGIWLTTRIRSQVFKSFMRQEMSWFDADNNSVGALSARLAGDAANVQGSIGYPLSGIIQSITNFIMGVSIAFYFSWKLALLCLVSVPFVAGSVVYEAKYMTTSTLEEKEILEEASRIATEAITNIRTVAGLRREAHIIARFNKEIQKIETILKHKLRLRGLVNSCAQSFPFFGYAAALCYGGVLVSRNEVPFQNIIKVSESLLYGSMMLGQSLAFTPAFTAALIAGHRLFKLIDRKSRIQSSDVTPRKANDQEHSVSYRDIYFRYPKRPDIPVLQGLDLEVLKGKTVALVGHSGCGKSTCVQLLQRFYDPDNGRILLGQNDVASDLSLSSLRSKLGIVSQEPVLFEKTIAENIAYGDNTRDTSLAEIMDAAKMANIHNFIVSLPFGYDTCLGSKGTQLSGGEKQRIAIARAVIRNPKVLLLDEATSALDLQSEKLVQDALDIACSGRTCIVIAHRLSTIQNADVICVLQNGEIVEQGTHQQLLMKDGLYARLYKIQPALE